MQRSASHKVLANREQRMIVLKDNSQLTMQSPETLKVATADDLNFTDFASLHRLLVSAFSKMRGRIDPPSSMERLTVSLLREKALTECLILALDNDQLVGCVFLRHGAVSYIGKLAVRAEYRRQGVAIALLRYAEQMAATYGCERLQLEVRVELTENHRFFESRGFEKCGENSHAGYNRATSYLYQKSLGANHVAVD